MKLLAEDSPTAVGAPLLAGTSPILSVIVPVFCEYANIAPLYDLLTTALQDIAWEIIVVDDDSPDGTAREVRRLSATYPNIRIVQRIGRRGLSSAVTEGILSSSAPYVAVIDGDMQHDERILPQMLSLLQSDDYDIVIGSRYTAGGGTGEWDESRVRMSRLASKVSRLIVKAPLSDPMSGFFAMTRPSFENTARRLSKEGFKILLDIFASSPEPLRFAEVPYEFRTRVHGESKLDALVLWEYFLLIVDKLVGRFIPVKFIAFSMVGTLGLIVHFSVLWTGLRLGGPFTTMQAGATIVAMMTNFFLNNILTYRDRRLKGAALLRGLLSFYIICGAGAVANVGIAGALFSHHYTWWLSALCGVAVGTVWNFAVTNVFTWKAK